uniref:Uncharacterized protein n=1 Tax=Euplotes crassus TaxID=5936 RepID=A0A7S3P0F7_EUPCR|mmetsp:Transcript_4395/g.4100  ORF Transcript_4395/g.4100 Transcript_4395/m.4100 type:complete len:246 (+) Transcript_4395:67-804(+)
MGILKSQRIRTFPQNVLTLFENVYNPIQIKELSIVKSFFIHSFKNKTIKEEVEEAGVRLANSNEEEKCHHKPGKQMSEDELIQRPQECPDDQNANQKTSQKKIINDKLPLEENKETPYTNTEENSESDSFTVVEDFSSQIEPQSTPKREVTRPGPPSESSGAKEELKITSAVSWNVTSRVDSESVTPADLPPTLHIKSTKSFETNLNNSQTSSDSNTHSSCSDSDLNNIKQVESILITSQDIALQ